ncbi:hypothetical protein RFI_21846 [Reticulomyxa filosa]|uniref:Uncharacterized protein n=1 Tax=Reticulomyxa filosa TaxID=46433 RepID=X6MNU6_RETFI|nr:hypothetical protein RFI_21846 [Reticulomyxa filosa]|eukprot:ETO15519.1 hypothetical protein RFI_21846 [Reticulomyxa filosa]
MFVVFDYSISNNGYLICSGSDDNTVRVWDINTNKQIRLFDEHVHVVTCAKFSPYHYHNVICSSSYDKTICFWDIKQNIQLRIFEKHKSWISNIEFSSFNSGRYLCSVSDDKTIRLWDIKTYKSLHIFNGHEGGVWCIDFSPLQNNNNNNKINNIGIIGGNGYTICSGSFDNTIRIWDIETTKQLIIFKGHKDCLRSVKYGLNELRNIILSGSQDKSIRLWDIRSNKQIQIFNGHKNIIYTVEYSPFIINNNKFNCSSNIICSGSLDNTIRFWDIRSNKNELYIINGDQGGNGIHCLKFLQLQKKENNFDINLCYGSGNGNVHILG